MIGPSRADSATRTVRAGLESDTQHGSITPALHLSSNFGFLGFDCKREYDYTRSGNPTRQLLVDALADLEGAAGGAVTSSGMSAIAVALHLVGGGARVLAPHDGYGGTYRLLRAFETRGQIDLTLVDFTDSGQVGAAFERGIDLCWIETPSNPLLRVTPLRETIAAAKRLGALVVVDNTFLSPVLQRPLEFGADVVVHSTTKYLNGHSDVVGGAVLARDAELVDRIQWWANCLGVTGAPFDTFLTLRGLRTLHARMRCHEENAARIAAFLASDPRVERVYYPGLESDPGHELAKSQQDGFGGMISFELSAVDGAAASRFCESIRLFSLAESLGGVESLIAHPATMTHAAMDAPARIAAGISDRLLRLSVGIEDVSDLITDLDRALRHASAEDLATSFARGS